MNAVLISGLALTWILIIVGCWLGWQLLRQNGRILLRLDELEKRFDEMEFGGDEPPKGLPVGTEAPTFELPDLAGEHKSLARFRGQSLLLAFFNPDCDFCRELMPKLAALETERGRSPSAAATNPEVTSEFLDGAVPAEPLRTGTVRAPLVLILTTGDAAKNRQFFAEHTVACPVLLQNDGEVAKAYQTHGTPTGYLVSADGKIASELAIGAEALLTLASQPAQELPLTLTLSPSDGEREKPGDGGDGRTNRFSQRSLVRSKLKRDGLRAGTPAPDFRLPRLDGGELALADLNGKRVLLVFSDPHCGPCQTLAPELEKCHRERTEVFVVMISRGELKENCAKVKERGLTFPVVLQRQWEISRLYAMFATPVAYLIDETGTIIHDVAVGVEPILTMMDKALESPCQPAVAES